MTRVNELTRGS